LDASRFDGRLSVRVSRRIARNPVHLNRIRDVRVAGIRISVVRIGRIRVRRVRIRLIRIRVWNGQDDRCKIPRVVSSVVTARIPAVVSPVISAVMPHTGMSAVRVHGRRSGIRRSAAGPINRRIRGLLLFLTHASLPFLQRLFKKPTFDHEADQKPADIEYGIQPELPVLTKAPATLRSSLPGFIPASRC
jgi:hypothetical protein